MNKYANNSKQLLKYTLYKKNFWVNVDISALRISDERWKIENASCSMA